MSQGTYICQRAAEAIVAEIGPLRLSNDALQAINLFLDEFLAILVLTAAQLDLVRIKAAVIQILPHHSLGKNALVEAEIELKQQLETSTRTDQSQQSQPQHDFSSYEKMRSLTIETNGDIAEPGIVISLIQRACAGHSALSFDKTTGKSNSKGDLKSIYSTDGTVIIAPVVTIYITAIVEHIAEYLLNAIAVTADRVGADYIKVKEVLYTLLEDPQVGNLFRRMNLKETLEKKLVSYQNSYINSLPSPAPSPVAGKKEQFLQRRNTNVSTKDLRSCFNEDASIMYEQQRHNNDIDCRTTQSSTACSLRSSESISDRPLSIISSSTTKSSTSSSTATKSRFNIFGSNNATNSTNDRKKSKDKRTTTISLGFSSVGAKRNSSSSSTRTKKKKDSARTSSSSEAPDPVTPPPVPALNAFSDFDDLLKSGDTKKVSLTPNRLKSIEVRAVVSAPTATESSSSEGECEEEEEEEEEDVLSRNSREIKVASNASSIARSSSSTSSTITVAKKRSADYLSLQPLNSSRAHSSSVPPLPPLPRLSREQMNSSQTHYLQNNSGSINNHSPPLTPASSLASWQPSQRSGYSASNNQASDDLKQQQRQQQQHQLPPSYASSILSRSSSRTSSSLKSSATQEEVAQKSGALQDCSPLTASSIYLPPILRRTPERIPSNNMLNNSGSAANNSNRRNVIISQSSGVFASSDSISTVQPSKPSSLPVCNYERPSSNVLKRASMGSRPPSFHESMFDMASGGRSASAMLLGIYGTSNNLHGLLKDHVITDDDGKQTLAPMKEIEKSSSSFKVIETSSLDTFDEAKQQRQDMIYLLPPTSSMSYNTLSSATDQRSHRPMATPSSSPPQLQHQNFKIPRKSVSNSRFFDASIMSPSTTTSRGIDQACQTDPVLDFSMSNTYTNNDDEEWFFEDEHDDSGMEDERLAVEWLLGCA